ncbi:MAG: polynucleotide adenylyltransferase PcnB, partial [Xanthomonadales bacterium]|nr:polynucleotide adenylyltransferase PcnB [Xanthomonadales bacterium]
EDPVRMLRAVRLAAKLDFRIDVAAAEPIPRLAGLLGESSSARLFDESLKLFMAGHAEASWLGLETHGLLDVLFPESTPAMLADESGGLRRLLLQALRNTDERIRESRPVTPAFLFAALLWPAYTVELAKLQAQGLEIHLAQQRAADRVVMHQAQRIALPRRFSIPMQEIWMLQSRFPERRRKRVFRLLSHPRFRAAYDFLELRLEAEPELAEEFAFWRDAQALSGEQLSARLGPPRSGGGDPQPSRKRRRRRRRKPASGSSE